VEKNTLNAATGQFTTAKTSSCANVSSIDSRAEKICGWDGGHPGLTVGNLVSCTTIQNAHKVGCARKLTFYIMCLSHVQLLGGQYRCGLEWHGRQ